MLTLYDYLPSQNAYKVRLLLHHLDIPYRTELVSIFNGEGQRPEYLAVNPTGAVPAIRLEDGRTLAESNAILWYLGSGTRYLPGDPFAQANVLQWLNFEADYVQSTVATLRHWTMTGKAREASLLAGKRAGSEKVLAILDRHLAGHDFLANESYSIADIAVFAYVHRATEADLTLPSHVARWVERVQGQDRFLATTYPYSIDPHSGRELP